MGVVKKEGRIVSVQQGDKWRKVGEIEEEDGFTILKVHRDRSAHLMRVYNAYGFSKDVIDHDDWFDFVLIEEEVMNENVKTNNTYFIPRQDIVLEGKSYQSEGFERQYFVSLEKLQTYKQ
jgi:hypothetical protein